MNRRLIALLAALVAIVAVAVVLRGAAAPASSSASFTTSSQSTISASTDIVTGWLWLRSHDSDPAGTYAYSRGLNGVQGPYAATGKDTGLAVDLGDFPDKNKTYSFTSVFQIWTPIPPSTFPDPAVTNVRIAVTLVADPATGEQPLKNATITTPAGTTAATVTVGVNQKCRFNVQVAEHKKFVLGTTYTPEVVVTVTPLGTSYPSGYYVYTVPVTTADSGGS